MPKMLSSLVDKPILFVSMTFRSFKIGLCLVALFVLGAVCGTRLSYSTPLRKIAPQRPAATSHLEQRLADEVAWLEVRSREEGDKLKLTPDQLQTLRPAFDATRERIRALQKESGRELRQIMKDHREKMLPLLTPEQRHDLKKLNEERRARLMRSQAKESV
jgi:Spy/CpxP family protein refolding chaperone